MSNGHCTQTDHPWSGSEDEFMRDVIPLLREHGKKIGIAAARDDKDAIEIMSRYSMLYRSYDPMTAILVKLSLEKWLKANS